jgi:hypothetical protein
MVHTSSHLHRRTLQHSNVGWLSIILGFVTITALMFFSGVMNNSILMNSDPLARNQSFFDSAEPSRTGSVTKDDER